LIPINLARFGHDATMSSKCNFCDFRVEAAAAWLLSVNHCSISELKGVICEAGSFPDGSLLEKVSPRNAKA
jgi:hypothetical protein